MLKNIATSFLNKDFNAYYHSVKLLKGKCKNSCHVIDGHSTNKVIADCFAESYKTVFNDVGYDKTAMSELLNISQMTFREIAFVLHLVDHM